MPESIPDAVRRLIAERIDSVPELEAVLLLRENRDRAWTAEDAGKRLYVSTVVAAHLLHSLAEREFFLEADGTWRYGPASQDLAATVDLLAVTYARHLVAVTHLIHSKPSQNVRDFAEAFRLRRPK